MAVRTKRSPSRQTSSHLNEFVGIVFFALAILSFFSLISYSASDWSLSTASTESTKNWVGPVGSVLADLLFQSVGSMAYPLPILFVIIGIRYLFGASPKTRISRVIGFFVFVFSGASLLTLAGFYGGLSGAFFYSVCASLLNDIGSAVLFTALLFASLILVTNFSYTSFFESLHMATSNFRIRFGEWWEKYKKDRAVAAEAKAKEKGGKTATAKPAPTPEKPTISSNLRSISAFLMPRIAPLR